MLLGDRSIVPRPRRGNVVVNILVAVGVLLLLGAVALIFLPSLPRVGEEGWSSMSKTHQMRIALAVHDFHDDHGQLPFSNNPLPPTPTRQSWLTRILPPMGHGGLYERIDFDREWDAPVNDRVFATPIPELLNPGITEPTAGRHAVSHYAANVHLYPETGVLRFRDITDGTMHTIMGGEINANFQPWGRPDTGRDLDLGINTDPDGFGSPFDGGANFMLLDGSVRFIGEDVDQSVLRMLARPNDGGRVDLP